MTRINLVPPSELSRLHLVAEYRELPRVFGLVRRHQSAGRRPADLPIPDRYTLGRGHMMFFANKLRFLVRRQWSIVAEMRSRGYSVTHGNPDLLLEGISPEWQGDYVPDELAIRINRERIKERS